MAPPNTQTKSHPGRNDLTGEHSLGDAGQLILALLFASVWILDTFFLKYTTSLNQVVHLGIRIPLGITFLLISAYLSRNGLSIVFGETREVPVVIRDGVFNLIRHPIYLGEILLYLGLLMFSLSLASAALWVIAILFLHAISRYEEKLLIDRFGEAYRQYMREVPMWFPRLRRD